MLTNIEKIKEAVNSETIVSFDVFDTLLLRPFISPTDVFDYIEYTTNSPGFKSSRIKAEKRVRKNAAEVTIDEIYAVIPDFCDLKTIELNREEFFICPNPEITELYAYALKNAKTVIITTDIYFSEDFIVSLLKKNGFDGFSGVFVSSEYKATKHNSDLFEIVLKKLNINPKQLIHIGDNPISDYASPQKLGIKAFCIKKAEDVYSSDKAYRINNSSNWIYSLFAKTCALRFINGDYTDYWHRFGYEIAGPFCFAFSKWINNTILNTNKDSADICFVARDGYLLKKVYELVSGQQTKYVYAPRLVKSIADIKDFSDISLINSDKYKPLLSHIADICNAESELKAYLSFYSDYVKGLYLKSNTFLIDSRTQNFSSQILLKEYSNSNITGLYFINSLDTDNMDYISYYQSRNNPILSWNMIEYFLSAPTPSVIAVNAAGPIYAEMTDSEAAREKQFASIEKGVLEFAYDILNKNLDIAEIPVDVAIKWINDFLQNPDKTDKKEFEKVVFANDLAHKKYTALNPFFEKPKSWADFKGNFVRSLTLHPKIYEIIRKGYLLYRKFHK